VVDVASDQSVFSSERWRREWEADSSSSPLLFSGGSSVAAAAGPMGEVRLGLFMSFSLGISTVTKSSFFAAEVLLDIVA